MKKILSAVIVTLFASFAFHASAQTNQADGPVLIKFKGGTTVSQPEFETAFCKGNPKCKEATAKEIDEYLDLYIRFKRKVIEAEKLGLGERKEFKDELAGYTTQLAQPYLVEKDVQEKLIREAYDRSKELINASHILVNCSPDASPADSLRAYKLALSYRDSITNHGVKFEDMARRHSDDPSAKTNLGNLGYFSVFEMVYPFETGAFKTPVGSVSMPVRSGFGYHLIKVNDRLQNKGKQTAAHIIIRIGPTHSAKDTAQAVAKINEIYNKLKEGRDFAEMASSFSDDKLTAPNGGDLGNGRLIPEMENEKRKLREGEYSQPFSTPYGWHILKVTKVEPLKTFEESQADIKSRISRDARSYLSREMLVERVKKEYNYKLNNENLGKFNASVGDANVYAKGFWKPDTSAAGKALYALPLFTMGSGRDLRTGTVQDYVNYYLKVRKGFEGATAEQVTQKHLEGFEEEEMLKFEQTQLPRKYPEYKALLREYRDGILLFTLTEEKVWRKAVEDTVGLRKFYTEHPDSFRLDERVIVEEYSSESRATMDEVERYLAKGWHQKQIDSMLNATAPLNLRVRNQIYEKSQASAPAELFGKQAGYRTGISETGKVFRIVVVKEYKPAGIAAFDEVRPKVITKYQTWLDHAWAKELAQKYPAKVNKKVRATLLK